MYSPSIDLEEAFTLNRLINDAKVARTILDELIEANKGMWPELK